MSAASEAARPKVLVAENAKQALKLSGVESSLTHVVLIEGLGELRSCALQSTSAHSTINSP